MESETCRVFAFSFDEKVYASDVMKIIEAARQFPESKLFCLDTEAWDEVQTYVLAENEQMAAEIYNKHYNKPEIDRYCTKASDFSRGDLD